MAPSHFFARDICVLPWLALSLPLAYHTPSLADLVWLKNGDRLSGKIQYREKKALVLTSPSFGRIVIKWTSVQSFQSDVALELELRGQPGKTVSKIFQSEPGTILLADGEVITLKQIESLVRPGIPFENWHWDGDLDIELDVEDESDSKSRQVTLDLDTTLEKRWWRFRLESEIEYETKNNRKTDDNAEHTVTGDYFVDEEWYLRGRLERDRDSVNNDFLGREIGAGVGRRFYNDAKRSLDAAVELDHFNYQWVIEDSSVGEIPLQLDFEAVSMDLQYDEKLAWLPLDFKAELMYLQPFSIPVDYIIDGEISLKYRLNSWARLTFKLEYDETRAEGVNSRDTRTVFGFGVSW
jgi:hypothetical protein